MADTTKTTSYVAVVLNGAVAGAIVGGTASAALSIRKVNKGLLTKEEAAKTVAREAGTASMATGAATAVAAGLGLTGVGALVSMALVATGTKYLLDQRFAPELTICDAPVQVKEEKPAAPKSAAKKSTATKTTTKKPAAKKTTATKTAAKKTAAKKPAAKKTVADKTPAKQEDTDK